MKKTRLYYIAPDQECFDDLKSKAIKIWKTYDDTYSYATKKISQIEKIKNIEDNFMYMVAMFDYSNQVRLSLILSDDTRRAVSDRFIDGGQPQELNPFLIKEPHHAEWTGIRFGRRI